MTHGETYRDETLALVSAIDWAQVDRMAKALARIKGVFVVIGLGGGAANASHFTNDLLKLCHKRAQCMTDNAPVLTAMMNDHGVEFVFSRKLRSDDALFIFSVGGGTDTVSTGITLAIHNAKRDGAKVFGIVGPDGGETARLGDYVIRVPASKPRITPHTEGLQMVIAHALVSHPALQKEKTVW